MGKNKVIQERNFSWIKQYYINGRLQILGSSNLYGLWNSFLFRVFRYCHNKWGKTKIIKGK